MERHATCACGQLSVLCRQDPLGVSVCHCLACKQLSGSAFSWNARFDADAVDVLGDCSVFSRRGDEGSVIENSFCPGCGVTVLYRNSDLPGFVMVRAGCFADADFDPPSVSVYDPFRRCAWLSLDGPNLHRLG